jgi:hypothetical protein
MARSVWVGIFSPRNLWYSLVGNEACSGNPTVNSKTIVRPRLPFHPRVAYSALCRSYPSRKPNKNVPEDGKRIFRYGELNPGLAGLMLCLRAADASHYTITDYISEPKLSNLNAVGGRPDG